MRIVSVLCTVAVAFAVSTVSFGHGIPITVTVDETNKLVASNLQQLYSPIDLTSGYASMVLVDDEDGAVTSQDYIFRITIRSDCKETINLRLCRDLM